MPIYRDKAGGCFRFEFDRRIGGQRVRATKSLPRSWNRAQADAFDRQESARLYAVAQGIGGASHSIEDCVTLYLTHRVPDLKHGHGVAQELHAMLPEYMGRPLSALPDVCKAIQIKGQAVTADRPKPLAPATIKNRISILRAACRYAWRNHNLGDTDPGARVTVPQVKNERHHYISRAQMLALCLACDHRPTRSAIRIAFYSGMRLGEIERVEVIDGRFVLRDTKNGDPRIIPVHPKIRCCLNFTRQTRFITGHHFRKARAAVGMPWLHFHDIRHSAASELINAGVDLYTVGAILGHKSQASTKRYSHLATERLDEAIRKMGRRA
jgi:integrase